MKEEGQKKTDFWSRLGLFKGDTKRQALIRDKFYKKREKLRKSGISYFEGPDVATIYLEKILKRIKLETKLLDIGCGTGHILQKIAETVKRRALKNAILVGLDLSLDMVDIASKNTNYILGVFTLQGNAYCLPFPNSSFDIAINRTSPYSLEEVLRILKKDGCFVRYEQGLSDYPEIAQAFGERYTIELPSWNVNPERWKEEDVERHREVRFREVLLREYGVTQYYSREDLTDLIEFVPLAKSFDRMKDKVVIDSIEKKYRTTRGIAISRQYSIMTAKK